MTNGANIAAEISAALVEASSAVGDGPLTATILRSGVKTGPDYAPAFGPDVEYEFNAVIGRFNSDERSDTAVRSDDIKLLLGATGNTPVVGDSITVSGSEYDIYRVIPVATGGVYLMYTIWAHA